MSVSLPFSERIKKAYSDTEITALREIIVAMLAALITFGWRRWQGKVDMMDDLIPIAIACVASAIMFPVFSFIWNYIRAPRKILEERLIKADSEMSKIKEQAGAVNLQKEWKELAARFETLPNYIRAEWHCQRKDDSTVSETWNFAGGTGTQVETLCRFAGILLMKSPNVTPTLSDNAYKQSSPVWRWLFFLKEQTRSYSRGDGLYGEGEGGTIYLTESIHNVGAASAAVCIDCAASEL